MGTIARMLDRRAAAKPTWELLWLPATFFACIVVITDHLVVRLRRRRTPADAGGPIPRRHGWRIATCLAVYVVAARLAPQGPVSLVVVSAGFAMVLVERVVARIAKRRDAEHRRREVDDLARQKACWRPMGAAAEMLRRREKHLSGPRFSWREIVAVLPVWGVFVAAACLLPWGDRVGSTGRGWSPARGSPPSCFSRDAASLARRWTFRRNTPRS